MVKTLLKETLDLLRRRNCLKTIDKEIKKRDRCYEQYRRHHYVAGQLINEYAKLYPPKTRGDNNAKEKE